MTPDWTRLAPNRPLDPGDGAYLPRPLHPAELRIHDWILTGRSPLLVAGPVGVGKSTELAFAAKAIGQTRVATLVRLDRTENMRTVAPDRVLLHAGAGALADVRDRHHGVDERLENELKIRLSPGGASRPGSALDVVRIALRESARMTGSKPCLLIDGLEKTLDEPVARAVFDALAELLDEADLVVVVPFNAAYGPGSETVLAPGERLVLVPPIDVEDEADDAGREFFRDVMARRLDLPPGTSVPPDFAHVVDRSARLSGGIPRTFLQLIADAATYARAIDGAPWPDPAHFERALADQQDSFRRLLLPGDAEALKQADGSDGRELPLPRKLRLLSHGLLLERQEDGRSVMRPHPLARVLLGRFSLV